MMSKILVGISAGFAFAGVVHIYLLNAPTTGAIYVVGAAVTVGIYRVIEALEDLKQ